MSRLRKEIERIARLFSERAETGNPPLEWLASEFRYGLTVTAPQGVRVQDPEFTVERLFASLVAPEPFVRAASTAQFVKALGSQIGTVLQVGNHVSGLKTNFLEPDTFQPIRIAASWLWGKTPQIWRGVSFSSTGPGEPQLTLAKAFHAENLDLLALEKYRGAKLTVAVQLPKPDARADFNQALGWIKRDTPAVFPFEDRHSIEQRVPELLREGLMKQEPRA
jgi:hypothetical protein